ncbi:phosphoacetylglucosamine mutase, putative [Plasmodium yoelii]|uniref:phosphoacetylglucosamine mutase n=2 Tax=Plasmodium yoelii TaxID=5861 RepID=A0AAF0B4L2_PLAYO|nr:phosphoacetylglucosamine mutase, putative [Plasmodium yoelii]WBY57299.1 phosphoacetylglucosamine mutase [Plasmodium yoelii yoelii]CDU17971.1 phosphoacetylglucosamine mutase, putative [Plasmodium yoelii]VTZ78388.1 phosphoacetylglucosamine mutase, putative [Plasmodium yoelii]|eukprot:XP_729993.2 phosphoacetylglucosamine mutase, putative [Plasmodium yoelii]
MEKNKSEFYKRIYKCIEECLPNYVIEKGVKFESDVEIYYGNSGFRGKYKNDRCDLINVLNKSGIILGLLFIKYNYKLAQKYNLLEFDIDLDKNNIIDIVYKHKIKWKNIGIVITASHNPFDENGIKIIDKDGRQINEIYENYLSDLSNKHLKYIKENKNNNCKIEDIINNIIDTIVHIFLKETQINLYDNKIYNHIKKIDNIIYYCNIYNKIVKTNICIGFDTRDSGLHLNKIIINTLTSLNISKCINNMCYITTPSMHFLVYIMNSELVNNFIQDIFFQLGKNQICKTKRDLFYLNSFNLKLLKNVQDLYFGIPEKWNIDIDSKNDEMYSNILAYNSDEFYFDYFIYLFNNLYNYINTIYDNIFIKNCKKEIIYVDCSNGIASLKIDKFNDIFKILKKNIFKFNCLQNDNNVLNFECGADYVYNKKKIPSNIPLNYFSDSKFCAFDGDADRIIYFFIKNDNLENQIEILDGNKIACLLFKCIIKMLSNISIKNEANKVDRKKIDINIIHTAYVNSAFTNYINSVINSVSTDIPIFNHININVICTKTGMKNLDNIARKSSIGILFESNGHGSIYANSSNLDAWAKQFDIQKDPYFIALKKYLLFFNQTTGDAIIDFIAIELSLNFLNLNINQWNMFYTSIPSLYINIECPRYILNKIIPHPQHELYLIEPKSLQNQIEEIVKKTDMKYGRCFIRPSGTENLIRIYAEAETVKQMDEILDKVQKVVVEYINNN